MAFVRHTQPGVKRLPASPPKVRLVIPVAKYTSAVALEPHGTVVQRISEYQVEVEWPCRGVDNNQRIRMKLSRAGIKVFVDTLTPIEDRPFQIDL